jgi:predicted membrane-bound mannosyltransferase
VPLGLGIIVLAAALRLPELALNPFHHDEGVNGFFTTRLMRENRYAYDPANYHGPSLYYFALASAILFGLTTEALRLVTVLAGLATVALVLPLRRHFGAMATLTAALLIAISPGAIYVSRYFIHEALLVCFSLGLVVSVHQFAEHRRPTWLLAAAAFAALIFTTKETGIITVGVLVIAAIVADRYVAFRHPERARANRASGGATRRRTGGPPPRSIWVDGVEYRPAAEASDRRSTARGEVVDGVRGQPRAGGATGGRATLRPAGDATAERATLRPAGAGGSGFADILSLATPSQLVGAVLIFLVIWVLLFSSFFTNYPKGLVDSLATFMIWTQTGQATQLQPPLKYLEWMLQADAPILLLGAVGGALVAVRATDRLSVFVGLWALGITLAYSLIQYKTPWIALNMLVPLALLAGILIRDLWSRATRQAVPLLLGGTVVLNGYQAVDLNYVHYDDERYGYVFVHTTRETLDLLDEIGRRATEAGTGRDTGVVLVTPDYWPLPWYLRDYPRAGFYGRIVPTQEAIVIAKVDQEKELDADFTAAYARQAQYKLRPGVDLVLYLRRSTFGL